MPQPPSPLPSSPPPPPPAPEPSPSTGESPFPFAHELPMDEEWFNDESVITPPGADAAASFRCTITIVPTLKSYFHAKPSKRAVRTPSASADAFDALPPLLKLKSQTFKFNTIDQLRQMIWNRYSRALMGE